MCSLERVLAFGKLFAACLLPVLANGCHRPTVTMVIESESRGQSWLVSELREGKSPSQRVQCPFTVTNSTAKDKEIILASVGCSCYAVVYEGKKILAGEKVTIPAGRKVTLAIEGSAGFTQQQREFQAAFHGEDPALGFQPAQVRCTLEIYQDLRLSPNVMTAETPRGKPFLESRQVLIEHTFRGTSADGSSAPTFSDLPPHIQVLSIEPVGEPENLEEDIWRRSWQATLEINLPASETDPQPLTTMHVVAHGPGEKVLATSDLQLTLHTPRAIAYPSRIRFGQLKVAEPKSRRVLLTSTDKEEFDLRVDEAQSLPGLSVSVDSKPSVRHWLELTLTPQAAGPLAGAVVLQTNRPEEPVITIQIEGVVESAPN